MLYLKTGLASKDERPLISYKEDYDDLYFIAYRILYNEYMNKGKLLCRENYEKASNHLYSNELCLNQATEEQFNIILNEALKLLYEVAED